LALTRIGFGHQQGDLRAFTCVGEGCEEPSAFFDDAIVVAVDGVGGNDASVPGSPLIGTRELAVEEFQNLRRPSPMEIGNRGPLLGGKSIVDALLVEQQRENTVQKAGLIVHRSDVSVEREVAGSERDGLVGCRQEEQNQRGKGTFAIRAGCPGKTVERVGETGRFVVVADGFEES